MFRGNSRVMNSRLQFRQFEDERIITTFGMAERTQPTARGVLRGDLAVQPDAESKASEGRPGPG